SDGATHGSNDDGVSHGGPPEVMTSTESRFILQETGRRSTDAPRKRRIRPPRGRFRTAGFASPGPGTAAGRRPSDPSSAPRPVRRSSDRVGWDGPATPHVGPALPPAVRRAVPPSVRPAAEGAEDSGSTPTCRLSLPRRRGARTAPPDTGRRWAWVPAPEQRPRSPRSGENH